MVNGSIEQKEYLESKSDVRHIEIIKERCTFLPSAFIPIGLSSTPKSSLYLSYLMNRGLSERDMALYRIGYADIGEYSGRIIIPSFDAHGMVNFFSARTVHDKVIPSYLLPDSSKDIISNEHMVDWTKPVYLVEGIFDEIAIGPQAIALYGKFLQQALALRLVERKPPIIYVCLDNDARKQALQLMKRLIGYDLVCSLLDLDGKDPSSVGLAGVQQAVMKSKPIKSTLELIIMEQ